MPVTTIRNFFKLISNWGPLWGCEHNLYCLSVGPRHRSTHERTNNSCIQPMENSSQSQHRDVLFFCLRLNSVKRAKRKKWWIWVVVLSRQLAFVVNLAIVTRPNPLRQNVTKPSKSWVRILPCAIVKRGLINADLVTTGTSCRKNTRSITWWVGYHFESFFLWGLSSWGK